MVTFLIVLSGLGFFVEENIIKDDGIFKRKSAYGLCLINKPGILYIFIRTILLISCFRSKVKNDSFGLIFQDVFW